MLKKCTQCGLEKDVSNFYANYGTKDGYASMCKECQNKISTKYALEHKEELKQYKRERYLRRKQEFAELKKLVEENGLNQRNN